MTQYLFRNVELLDPAQDRLLGGREVLVEGRADPRGLRSPDHGGGRHGDRRRRADAHARADRLSRARVPERGEHPEPGEHPAHAHDRAGRAADARHDRPRLHDRARHGRGRLGHQGGGRGRTPARPAPVHLRARHRADGGHSDSRRRTDGAPPPCRCCNAMAFTMSLADGADEVRRAVRSRCARAPTRSRS